LGSFFYGYVASQLFGGFMIKKFGGKWVFGVGTLIEAILALCSPMVAKYGTGAYVTLRILQGISEVNFKNKFLSMENGTI
jgi:MFS family permease